MSKVLKVVAVVAAVVAVVASGGAALGAFGAAGSAGAATAMTVAAVASAVSAVASFGSQLLAKPPPARGSVNQLIVETNAVHPYVMGRTYFGGVLRHAASYGPTLDKIPNPYLSRVVVYSGAGPVDSFESLQVDYGPIGSYYSGFLTTSSQLGLCPETTALSAGWSGFPNWTGSHKLSGQAAAMWNFKFDRNGKVFASGLPQTGAVLRGVKVYDPRLDSTYPGGSGTQRITDESTWAYSDNPALHAIAYAYGRHQNGKKVLGVGLPIEAIDMTAMTAWANVCDANGWTISGVAFEPNDRWDNLKNIMAAGGAEPLFAGARLSVKYHAPRIALDTITEDDLADGPVSITAMRSYRDRINTIIPKWRSEPHNWDYVAGDDVSIASYVEEDGEVKKVERQYNFVADGNQATQLATYEMLERRELGIIELTCGPRMLAFRPGEALVVDLPDEGLSEVDAVILTREIDPGTMNVRFTLIGETPAKHAFALGKTATPPPTPSLTMTHEERDEVAAEIGLPLNTATVLLYARTESNSAPSVATFGFATYTFETGLIDGQPSGWSRSVPSSGGDYLWAIQAVASSRATLAVIYNTQWSAPSLVSQHGQGGVGGYLTNEAISLFAYADGTVASYAPATGSFKVFSGTTDVSSSFALSTIDNPQSLTVAYSARTYTISGGFDAGEDTATLTIRATGAGSFAGTTIDKVVSLSKAKGGYEIVEALPTTNLFEGRVIFLTTNDKLYRYTGSAWTAAVPAADVSGQLLGDQIADGAIVQDKIAARAIVTSKLAVTDFENLAVNGSVVTGTFDGWNNIVANSGSTISIGTDAVNWPSQHGILFSRHPSDSGELSITNGPGNWGTAGFNDGIQMDPGDEITVEATFWTSVSGSLIGFDCVAKAVGGAISALTAEALQNMFIGGTTQAWANPGPVFTKAVCAFKNTTGTRIRAFLRVQGPTTAGASGYMWNLKIRRRNNGQFIVDGSILANKLAADSVTANAIQSGAVTAGKIDVTQLSAITANVGLLRTATSGSRTEIEANQIRVYDSSNTLRVQLGVW